MDSLTDKTVRICLVHEPTKRGTYMHHLARMTVRMYFFPCTYIFTHKHYLAEMTVNMHVNMLSECVAILPLMQAKFIEVVKRLQSQAN
jgi:hypothetical protein